MVIIELTRQWDENKVFLFLSEIILAFYKKMAYKETSFGWVAEWLASGSDRREVPERCPLGQSR